MFILILYIQKKDEQAKKWVDVADAEYVKTVLCESRLMNDASSKGSDLKKLYTKVQGKYAVQTLQSYVLVIFMLFTRILFFVYFICFMYTNNICDTRHIRFCLCAFYICDAYSRILLHIHMH